MEQFYSDREQIIALFFFFCNDTATTEIYTLSLHDALPICWRRRRLDRARPTPIAAGEQERHDNRSEEHTSELQSQFHLVYRLLLEKKNIAKKTMCGAAFVAVAVMAVGNAAGR